MKAQDDFTITRETKLGLLIFLQSEKHRHQDDIEMIASIIDDIMKEVKLTPDEANAIVEMAERYRTF